MPDDRAGRPYRTWKWTCFERDRMRKARCWRCRQPIDYTLKQGNSADPEYVYEPEAYEPDHVKTWHEYPALRFVVSNGAPCHAKCNRSAGALKGAEINPDEWNQAEAWD